MATVNKDDHVIGSGPEVVHRSDQVGFCEVLIFEDVLFVTHSRGIGDAFEFAHKIALVDGTTAADVANRRICHNHQVNGRLAFCDRGRHRRSRFVKPKKLAQRQIFGFVCPKETLEIGIRHLALLKLRIGFNLNRLGHVVLGIVRSIGQVILAILFPNPDEMVGIVGVAV